MLFSLELTSRKLWSTELDRKTQADGKTKRHNIFNPTKSSTFKKVSGSTWKIRYGDGSTVSGTVGTDSVTLGGLCVENQAIELANKLSPQFTQGAGDGLLGLAFGKINTVKPKPVATPVEQVSHIFPSGSESINPTPLPAQKHTTLHLTTT